MEVSTNNNSTQQQQQQPSQTNNNNKNNNNATSIIGQQQIIISNDNSQSQTAKSSTNNLTELTATTTTSSIDNKINATSGSSFNNTNNLNSNRNSQVNSSTVDSADIINTNGDTSSAFMHNNHDKIDSNGKMAQLADINDETIAEDVHSIIESILVRIESSPEETIASDPITDSIIHDTALPRQSSVCIPAGDGSQTKTSLITPVADDEVDDDKTKDIVTLRNLEITPPPQPARQSNEGENDQNVENPDEQPKSKRIAKRPHSEGTQPSSDPSNSRSKRQRKQTELFQVETIAKPSRSSTSSERSTTNSKRRASSSSGRNSTAQSKQKQPKQQQSLVPPPNPQQQQQHQQINNDVIFYEKNDYLAIRNEENTFYLCQLAENVRVHRPLMKVKWLDTKDDGKTYFLTSHYDKVPQKSIIMPVILNKLKSEKKGEQLFSLDDQHKDTVMDRLRRSLNISTECEL